jgi:hypothetical protein
MGPYHITRLFLPDTKLGIEPDSIPAREIIVNCNNPAGNRK